MGTFGIKNKLYHIENIVYPTILGLCAQNLSTPM